MPAPESVGVIVARFQVPELHAGHIHLISHVRERHPVVLIVLGVHGGVRTKKDPLTFDERKMMIEQTFPEQPLIFIKPLRDHPFSHRAWSQDLDALIAETFPETTNVVLYGSRGSFIPAYKGRFPVEEVPTIFPDSGTALREALPFPHTRDARAAIIWDQEHRNAFMYSTSDLAPIRRETDEVLVGTKPFYDGKYSFFGGHAEKGDVGGLAAARREGGEEVEGIKISTPVLIDVVTVHDPRYRDTPDGVMTSFYRADYLGGEPKGADDMRLGVKWVKRVDLPSILVPWHQHLGFLLQSNWG